MIRSVYLAIGGLLWFGRRRAKVCQIQLTATDTITEYPGRKPRSFLALAMPAKNRQPNMQRGVGEEEVGFWVGHDFSFTLMGLRRFVWVISSLFEL